MNLGLEDLKDKLRKLNLDKNKKEVTLFCILILLIFIFLYFTFFLKGDFQTMFSQISEIGSMKTDMRNTKRDIGYEDILLNRLSSVEGKIANYERKLPAEQEIPMLLESVSDIARDSYVKILGIRPVPFRGAVQKDQSEVYQEIPILISAKSGYHQLATFINNLENEDRFMEVSDIKIKSSRTTPKIHDVELIVSTYVLLKQ